MRRIKTIIALAVALLLLSAVPAFARGKAFPDTIALPVGWQPEGIATGYDADFYAGSLANGAIYKGDLRTGNGAVWVPGQPGRVAVGLAFDQRSGYLFVAGGPTGYGRVYDTRTGEEVASYRFATGPTFVNDVIVTRSAAYFTDSSNAVLYVLPLGPRGTVPDEFKTLPLSGDWQQVAGFNANGIEATPDGKYLFVVNSTVGEVYRVDPASGVATALGLAGAVTMGDGMLLDGKTLYVVRNQANQIVRIRLSADYSSGQIVGTITDPSFRVPTTLAEHGNSLYVVNARFGVVDPTTADYDIVRLEK